jgi:hypothetical protein
VTIAAVVVSLSGAPSGQTAFAVSGAACELGQDRGDGLRTTHWELLRLTEVCTRVGTDSRALSLSLVLVYAGRPPAGSRLPEAKGKPTQILLTVRSTAAESAIQPRFTIAADGRPFDLAAATRPHQVLYPCDLSANQCGYDGVSSEVQLPELGRLAHGSNVVGHALGTDFALTASGREAVRRAAARATVH